MKNGLKNTLKTARADCFEGGNENDNHFKKLKYAKILSLKVKKSVVQIIKKKKKMKMLMI